MSRVPSTRDAPVGLAPDRAIDSMEHSYETRDHEIAYMGALPFSRELRTDPRFHDILRRLDLPLPDGSS